MQCPRQSTTSGRFSWSGPFELDSAWTGSFHKPSSRDFLITGPGCEPHLLNCGVGLLFALRGSSVRLLTYTRGLEPSSGRWVVLPMSDGRDLMLGVGEFSGQGTIYHSMEQITFNARGHGHVQPFFRR